MVVSQCLSDVCTIRHLWTLLTPPSDHVFVRILKLTEEKDEEKKKLAFHNLQNAMWVPFCSF